MESRDYLDELASKSTHRIVEAASLFNNIGVMYSTGKDSTLMLHLIIHAFPKGALPENLKFYHIDTRLKFPEIYQFRDYISKLYNITITPVSYDDLVESTKPSDAFECCNKRKTETLKRLIKEERLDAVMVGIRRDEMYERNIERVFSPRKGGTWEILREKTNKDEGDTDIEYLQDAEFDGWGIYPSYFGEDCDHVRIHPLLGWTELDVWLYTKRKNIPVNPLYFAKGGFRYRSLGCMPCTTPIKSNATDIDGIINELRVLLSDEREGRRLDKEKIQRRLRQLGYM